jgi:hypothetical protein
MTATTQSDDGIWVSPLRFALIVLCGCLICLLTFGPRAAIGLFMQPMSAEFSWSRDVFSLAFALQNLLWGTTYQKVSGAIVTSEGQRPLRHSRPVCPSRSEPEALGGNA